MSNQITRDRFEGPKPEDNYGGEYGRWQPCKCCGATHDEDGFLCVQCKHLNMVLSPLDGDWIEYGELACAMCEADVDQEEPDPEDGRRCASHAGLRT